MLGAIAVLRQRNVFSLVAVIGIGCFADGGAGSRIIFFASPRAVVVLGADASSISGAVVVGAGLTFNSGCVTGGKRILRSVTVTAVFAATGLRTQFAGSRTV